VNIDEYKRYAAQNLADSAIVELRGRRGFGDWWDSMAEVTRGETRRALNKRAWIHLDKALNYCPPPDAPEGRNVFQDLYDTLLNAHAERMGGGGQNLPGYHDWALDDFKKLLSKGNLGESVTALLERHKQSPEPEAT